MAPQLGFGCLDIGGHDAVHADAEVDLVVRVRHPQQPQVSDDERPTLAIVTLRVLNAIDGVFRCTAKQFVYDSSLCTKRLIQRSKTNSFCNSKGKETVPMIFSPRRQAS